MLSTGCRSTIITILLVLLVPAAAAAQSRQELTDSLHVLEEVLLFHPDSVDLRLRKAGCHILLEQWQGAKSEYDAVLALSPKNVAALYFRAFVNTKLGRYKFARQDYEAVLILVPGHFEALLGLALLNQKDKHYTAALDLLNALCDIYPRRGEAFAARADVEKERKMWEVAAYDLQRAVALDSLNVDYRLSLADVLLHLDRRAEARAELDTLVLQGVARPSLDAFYRRSWR